MRATDGREAGVQRQLCRRSSQGPGGRQRPLTGRGAERVLLRGLTTAVVVTSYSPLVSDGRTIQVRGGGLVQLSGQVMASVTTANGVVPSPKRRRAGRARGHGRQRKRVDSLIRGRAGRRTFMAASTMRGRGGQRAKGRGRSAQEASIGRGRSATAPSIGGRGGLERRGNGAGPRRATLNRLNYLLVVPLRVEGNRPLSGSYLTAPTKTVTAIRAGRGVLTRFRVSLITRNRGLTVALFVYCAIAEATTVRHCPLVVTV